MDSSAKRKVGAIALIVAGIGAFLVPFLLHSPALQASSSNGGNTNNNNNNGRTPTSTTCTTNCTPPSTDTNPTTCTSDPTTTDPSHSNEGKHLAKGHDKQDKPDTSLVGKAHGFMTALGKHNPQHDATHSTKIDNDTTDTQGLHSNGHDTDDTNACADNKDNDNSDDQGNDD
jgi:hypothetical protein